MMVTAVHMHAGGSLHGVAAFTVMVTGGCVLLQGEDVWYLHSPHAGSCEHVELASCLPSLCVAIALPAASGSGGGSCHRCGSGFMLDVIVELF